MSDTTGATTDRVSRRIYDLDTLADAIRAAKALGLRDVTVTTTSTPRVDTIQPRFTYHLDATATDPGWLRDERDRFDRDELHDGAA